MVPMSRTEAEPAKVAIARRESTRIWPFRHFRLVAFFGAVAAVGVLTGVLLLRRSHPTLAPGNAERILAIAVILTAGLGFAGVFVHRLRVLPVLWRETANFLTAIERESRKYRALLEGAADALLIVDPERGRLHEWNARAREELGLPASSAAPISIDSIVAPEDLQRLRTALRDAAASPGPAAPLEEIRLRGAGGRPRIADARLAAIALQDARVVLVSLRDLTRQKEMERELQIHERLSSVGLLTAGVAHEINNPLEGIGNYLKLLEREDLDPGTRKRHLDQVRHGFARIREIVRDLLHFARPESGKGSADLVQVVENARKLAAYSDRLRGVEVVLVGFDRPTPIVGDAGRLEQVVINLLLNAATAMKSNGKIRITVRETKNPRGAREHELAFEDGGPGIPPEDLERIFDPFFTTTEGTGLGLSVSYGIVRAHGGTISAENRPEGGARFTIRLPWRAPA
jgi:two-component system, NtrC family, sensor kinase